MIEMIETFVYTNLDMINELKDPFKSNSFAVHKVLKITSIHFEMSGLNSAMSSVF